MERNGPAIAREALGPLRRLVAGPDRARSLPVNPLFRYALPLALLPLLGLVVGDGRYLQDSRHLHALPATLIAVATVLPIALAVHRPLLAWRIAYPMMFLGVWHSDPRQAWPWSPPQILVFVIVFGAVALTESAAVTGLAVAFELVPVWLFMVGANAWGATFLLVAIALVGDLLGRRRRERGRLVEQAELTELERARRSVLEERARIAREMHDVVAHHMSMIAVQAETAPYRVDGLPPAARTEFTAIAASARAALGDMRRLLGVLRADDTAVDRAPQPGLAELDALVETAAKAGMPVTAELTQERAVPAAVALTAYRIVREALANAARHGPGGAVHLDCRGRADRLEVTVSSEITRPARPDGSGHGLIGMRERTALLGGTLTAGPSAGGDYYRVTAVLPFPVPEVEP